MFIHFLDFFYYLLLGILEDNISSYSSIASWSDSKAW